MVAQVPDSLISFGSLLIADREMKTLGGRQDAGLTIWEQGGDDETWTVLTLLPLLLISDIHLAWLVWLPIPVVPCSPLWSLSIGQ